MTDEESHSREKLSWIVIAAFWPAMGLAFIGVGLFSDPATFDLGAPRQLFLDWMTWVQWSLFTVPILLVARWIRRRRSRVAAIALHIPAAAGFTLLHLTTYLLLVALVRGSDPAALPDILALAAIRLPRHLLYNPLIYGAIVLAGDAARQYWWRQMRDHEEARIERLVAEAELDLLRVRIQPPLIVATFAAIRRLVDEDVARAEDAILRLGDFLRLCLASAERHRSTVEEEVATVRAWLDVLKVASPAGRFGTVIVGSSALSCAMPPAFLQILVDQAIGPERSRVFDLEIDREEDQLSVRMHLGIPRGGLTSPPALDVVESLLRGAYGDRFRLRQRSEGGSTEVELWLPIAPRNAASIAGDGPSCRATTRAAFRAVGPPRRPGMSGAIVGRSEGFESS